MSKQDINKFGQKLGYNQSLVTYQLTNKIGIKDITLLCNKGNIVNFLTEFFIGK